MPYYDCVDMERSENSDVRMLARELKGVWAEVQRLSGTAMRPLRRTMMGSWRRGTQRYAMFDDYVLMQRRLL